MLSEPVIKKIKITDISPNDYNPQEMPKEKFKGLVSHIRATGFNSPLNIRPKTEDDPDSITTPFVLVDGEHRLRAFMEIFPDEAEITCSIRELSRAQAILSTIAYNFQHGEENPIKMAAALREALDRGILIEDIEDITGMKRNRVEAFMDFQELPASGEGLDSFNPADTGGLKPKDDPIIMAFAVYPEDRAIIERAMGAQRPDLPPDTATEEEKGRCLVIMCQKILGEFVPGTANLGENKE